MSNFEVVRAKNLQKSNVNLPRRYSRTVHIAICFNHFVLIEVCSVDILVACLRISTVFFFYGFLERGASMRTLWSGGQNCSHSVSQKIKHVRLFFGHQSALQRAPNTPEFAQPRLSRVKGRSSPARGYKFGCVLFLCSRSLPKHPHDRPYRNKHTQISTPSLGTTAL